MAWRRMSERSADSKAGLKYLAGYPPHLLQQVQAMREAGTLGQWLERRHGTPHQVRTDRQLYDYVQEMKDRYLRKSAPLHAVRYDAKLQVLKHALGTHTTHSRVQGGRLKASREIRIATLFRDAPAAFLQMIAVHELAHMREAEHNKAFYQLCCHMAPDYHQLEFDLRVYLTHLEQA